MKKILSVYFSIFIFASPVFAAMADDSIDEEIRRTYRTDVIEKDLLPSLPKVDPAINIDSEDTVFTQSSPAPPPQKTTSTPEPQANFYNTNYQNNGFVQTQKPNLLQSQIDSDFAKAYKEIKIKKGTRFKLKLQNSISDTTPRGTRVTFVSVYPETSRYVTIPTGTVFKGQVVNSHSPQLLGNGGLIQIKVDQVVYKRSSYYIDSKVGIANHKRIYLNNIKGRHKYLKSTANMTRPGNQFMKKMWRISDRLSDSTGGILLVPVAVLSGVVVYGFNIVLSPVLSLFSMGESIKIPSGSYFEIKLTEDAIIREY